MPQDAAHAAGWFARAADSGLTAAQFDLGVLYCTGEGVVLDVVRGAEMYRLAAEGGHLDGMHNWGVMLLKGVGVDADEQAGAGWIEKARATREAAAARA